MGDRAGHVDFALDALLQEAGGDACAPEPLRAGDPSRPPISLSTAWGGGLGVEDGEDPAPGRIARRTLPGRLIVSGTAAPDVRHLTFASPSDTRTISPTGRARAFIVVYGGAFASGELTVTTTLTDGRTRRDRFSAGS